MKQDNMQALVLVALTSAMMAFMASARTMTMTVNQTDGEVSSFDFTFDNVGAGTTNLLWMACGNGDSGTSFSGWTSVRHVADILGDTTVLDGVLPPTDWGTGVKCLRFLLSDVGAAPGAERLDYIEATGGQRIMTSFTASGTTAVEADFEFTDTSGTQTIFCSRGTSTTEDIFILFWLNGTNWRFDYNNQQKAPSPAYVPGTSRHTLRADSSGLMLDGAVLNNTTHTAADFTAGGTMSLFASHQGGVNWNNYGKYKLYSFKAWSDAFTIALDLVPCKKDGVACLYDRVSGSFLMNEVSGSPFGEGNPIDVLEDTSDAVWAVADIVQWAVPCVEPMWWLQSANNWSPARFPGASDTAILGNASVSPADVYLAPGDTVAVTNVSVANDANAVVKIDVRSGASLTLGDPVSTNWFADAASAFSEIGVSGGALTVNGPAWFSDAGTGNVIRVTDGGTIDFNNIAVFGKSGAGYTGPTKMYIGPGSIVRQNASYDFFLGDGKTLNVGGGHGGEIEIDGGTFVAGNNFYIHCAPYDAWQGHGVIRLKGGEFSFAGTGQNIHFYGGGNLPNEFFQSGGRFAGNLSFQAGSASDNLVEVSGGTNECAAWNFGTLSGSNAGRMHMRIVGREGVVKVGSGGFHTPYNSDSFTEPPILMEFVVDPTTRRDSGYPVTPVYVTKAGYSSGYLAIRGVHHVRPAGGAQLVHRDAFPMYVKANDSPSNTPPQVESTNNNNGFRRFRYGEDDQYQTIGEEMWTNVFVTVRESEILGAAGYTWQFQQKLKDAAALVDGAAALATPVVRGYLALPSLKANNLNNMTSARVRLAVTPGDGETLQTIVDGFKANGYPDSVVESSGIYNVSLVIPAERLVAGVTTDKILFDFAEYPTYKAAKDKTPTIRATLSAAKWDPKGVFGFSIFVR